MNGISLSIHFNYWFDALIRAVSEKLDGIFQKPISINKISFFDRLAIKLINKIMTKYILIISFI